MAATSEFAKKRPHETFKGVSQGAVVEGPSSGDA
jgi:hypothetical protein